MPRGTLRAFSIEKTVSILNQEIVNKTSSNPPVGKYKVINLYIDPATNKLIVEYDNTPL